MSEQVEKKVKTKKKDVLSRLGRKPVAISDGVKVAIQGQDVQVEGKRGKLSWTLPPVITAKVEDNKVLVSPKQGGGQSKAFHGLSRKIVLNMIEGVSVGFKKKLIIEGVGFRAQIAGQKLTMTIGYSHPAVYEFPKEIKISLEPKTQNVLIIEGNDKQLVGQVAAEIRAIKKPEPYKGTGIRYDNEIVRRKAGKAAVGAGGGGKK